MKYSVPIDYATYREIMEELLRPIEGEGLDTDTLKRLYESKLVYLENLRIKCFFEVNQSSQNSFTMKDYELVLAAIRTTIQEIRSLVVVAVADGLKKRKVIN
jgi:hypothetical protein